MILFQNKCGAAKALNQAKFEANVKVDGKTNFKNKWPSPFALASGILLLLSFLKFVYPPLRWIAVAAVAAGIYPILAKAVASIGRKRVDINILVIITGNTTFHFYCFFFKKRTWQILVTLKVL